MDYKILRPRQNPRLQNYDYKTANHYFVTVCTHHKQCVFGAAGEPNGIGQMAAQGITAIPEHFPEVTVDEYVVMPNHVHVILIYPQGVKDYPQWWAAIRRMYPRCSTWNIRVFRCGSGHFMTMSSGMKPHIWK